MYETTQNNYDYVKCAPFEHYKDAGKGDLNGYVKIRIDCLTPLHIGSGFSRENKRNLVKEIVYMNKKPVIPGSSLKGCIRNIAETVSHSCDKKKCDAKIGKCISCSMFGTLSWASRVNFSEMLPVEDNYIIQTSLQPEPHTPKGKDGYRKFYKTVLKMQPDSKKITIDAVPQGASFIGKVFFKNITREELSLLMFSLGLDGSFQLMLGGFRYSGLGHIKITCTEFECNDKSIDPYPIAKEYENITDCKEQITKLREILNVRKGGAAG